MKQIILEKQLALYEKLIVLGITGLGTQALVWMIRYLDKGSFSSLEVIACWLFLGGNLYFVLCLVFNFVMRLKLLEQIK